MLIDLLTNSEEIVGFVKKKEGFGGVIEEEDGFFKLINLQIGFVDHFCRYVDKYIKEKKIDVWKYGYEVKMPRGKRIIH